MVEALTISMLFSHVVKSQSLSYILYKQYDEPASSVHFQLIEGIIVNMSFFQQSDHFTWLFFNIFKSTNWLLELVQTLHDKVECKLPLFSWFIWIKMTLWTRSLTQLSVSWAQLVSFWLTLLLVWLCAICWAGEEPVLRDIRNLGHKV